MEIKQAFKKLSEPQKYGPTVAGGIAGVFIGAYALDQIKAYTSTMGDAYDWLAKGGFTAAMIVGMLTVKPKGENDSLMVGVQTFFLTAAVTGGLVLVMKALGWGPLTIGRVGATGGIARTNVRVVGKPTTPTFAQAMPAQNIQQPGVIPPAFAEVSAY